MASSAHAGCPCTAASGPGADAAWTLGPGTRAGTAAPRRHPPRCEAQGALRGAHFAVRLWDVGLRALSPRSAVNRGDAAGAPGSVWRDPGQGGRREARSRARPSRVRTHRPQAVLPPPRRVCMSLRPVPGLRDRPWAHRTAASSLGRAAPGQEGPASLSSAWSCEVMCGKGTVSSAREAAWP